MSGLLGVVMFLFLSSASPLPDPDNDRAMLRQLFEDGATGRLTAVCDSLLKLNGMPMNRMLEVMHFKSMSLMAEQRSNECVNMFNQGISIRKPDSLKYWDVRFYLGLNDIYSSFSDMEDADNCMLRAQRIIESPEWKRVDSHQRASTLTQFWLAKTVAAQSRGDLKEAIGYWRKASPEGIGDPLRLTWLGLGGILHYKTGDTVRALSLFDKALRLNVHNPNKLLVAVYKAEILNFKRKPIEALTLLKKYSAQESSLTDNEIRHSYWLTVAHSYEQLDLGPDAAAAYDKSVSYSHESSARKARELNAIMARRLTPEKVESLQQNYDNTRRITWGICIAALILMLMVATLTLAFASYKRRFHNRFGELRSQMQSETSEKLTTLAQTLEQNEQQLKTAMMKMSQLDNGIREIQSEIDAEGKTSDERLRSIRLSLIDIAHNSSAAEKYDILFTRESRRFMGSLSERWPALSKTELEMCCYIALDLSTRDIAGLTHRSVRTVEAVKYSLRKKMSITGSTDAFVRRLAKELSESIDFLT